MIELMIACILYIYVHIYIYIYICIYIILCPACIGHLQHACISLAMHTITYYSALHVSVPGPICMHIYAAIIIMES